ncbi:MAG: WbqC family protein [Sphingobacteriia bacterium]|nr:WbqC family protein [Sphingobacteriia bacterium]
MFIVLDDADYRKNYFQNRTRIVDGLMRTYWLTMPVKHVHLGTPISQVLVDTSSASLRISLNRLREAYKDHWDNEFLQSVFSILEKPPSNLLKINMLLFDLVLSELSIKKLEIIPISKIVKKTPREERILTALKEVGATRLIVGMGAMATAHNLPKWEEAGIELDYQSTQNIQDNCSLKFGKGISILHDIVTVGSANATKIVRNFWTPERLIQ